jgi:hypothetical protein
VPNPAARCAQWLGLRTLADRLTRFPVPFYLPLSRLAQSPEALEAHLARLLEADGFVDPGLFLERQLKKRAAAIFLDGLDEIMNEDDRVHVARAISQFAGRFPGNLLVVTCRVAGLTREATDGRSPGLETEFPAFRRLELEEFTPEQVERFIRNWFAEEPSKAEGLLQALQTNPRIRWLTSNPLQLSLITKVYGADLELPAQRAALYQRIVELLLGRWDAERQLQTPAFDLTLLQRALGGVALGLHRKGVRHASRTEIVSGLTSALPKWTKADRDRLLDWLLQRSGLIRLESRDTYAFSHFTFQEFLVAWWFHDRGNFRALLRDAGNPWWREVVLLLAGLLSDPTKLLEELRPRDLMLAAAALADAQLVNSHAAGSEGFVRVAQAIVHDLQALHEGGGAGGLAAAEALAVIPGWGTEPYLIECAQREQGEPSLTAHLVLLRTANQETAARLWPKLGPLLRRLHRSLGHGAPELDQAILAALDRLGFPIVHVPAGPFTMGSDKSDDERPPHTVQLGDFWIGKYPVTNAQYARFVEETGYEGGDDWRGSFSPGKERHPVVKVSWEDTLAFCRWSGSMLPSEAEWEKAARGQRRTNPNPRPQPE